MVCLACCMHLEKVSISRDKDEKSLRTFNFQQIVKGMPLTWWHLNNFLVYSQQTGFAYT